MKALDLFCGAGGLSIGFKKAGFEITGVDKNAAAKETFELNRIGKFISADLSSELIDGDFDVVLGGPPCRPWATINTTRRGSYHPDYELLIRFFDHVITLGPKFFLLENVPALGSKLILKRQLERIRKAEYDIAMQSVRYSDFGAPTIRRRLIIFGAGGGGQKKVDGMAKTFFQRLSDFKTRGSTVKQAIGYLRSKDRDEAPDHRWPELTTIEKYRKYYETGKYGWYVLKWGEPAQSFGNIEKTYVLHPDSFNGGTTRVISVREAWNIMGFSRGFKLPRKRGMSVKYQLAVDAVSPRFSVRAGKVVKEMVGTSANRD